MSSVPGSGTPGSSVAGAVGGTTTSAPEPNQKDAYGNPVTPGERYVSSIQRVQGPKGNGAVTYLTYSTGESQSAGNIRIQTTDQLKAQAEQANIKELGFTPGEQFSSQSEVNQKVADLGITYKSETPNLVNGVITTGGPSVRDLYVQTLLGEVAQGYKGQGFKTEEDYLSTRLEQVGLAYHPETKTITDPLQAGLIEQQRENLTKGGYAGISFGGGAVDIGGLTIGGSSKSPIGNPSLAYGGLAQFKPNPTYESLVTSKNPTGSLDIAVKGLNKSQAQNIENNNSDIISNTKNSDIGSGGGGPNTSLSEKLGSSFGQKGLGYVPAINPDGTLNYSASQIASLISGVKENPEYGNNQNFLVANLGTENSTGSLTALNIGQARNTDIPNSKINQETNHNKTISLSETLGISEGIGGGSNQKSISNKVDIFSPEQLRQLILQSDLNARANYAVDKLANEQSINDFISSAKSSGAKTIDIFQENTDLASVFPAHETGFENIPLSISALSAKSSKLNLLESVPISKAKDVLTSLSNSGVQRNIFLSYTPPPKAEPQIGSGLDVKFENPIINDPLFKTGGAVYNFFLNTGLATESLGFSLAERVYQHYTNQPFKESEGITTPKNQEILNKYSGPEINLGEGTKTLITTGSLSDFESGQGPVYDIAQGVLTAGSFLIGSGITNIPRLVSGVVAKSLVGRAIGAEAKSAAIIYANKGSGIFDVKGTAQAEVSTGINRNIGTFKNLNMMRNPLPKDIFESDTAIIPTGSASVIIPKNTTLENTSNEIEQLRQSTNDLLKPSSIEPISNLNQPVQEDVLFINKVPMKSLGSNNGIGNQLKKVNTSSLLGTGETPPEDLTGGTGAPIKKPIIPPSTSQSSTLASSGLVPGGNTPGSNVPGAIGGASSAGVPDIFQQALSSRVDFERRVYEKSNPELFESNFIPISNGIISPSLRSTEIGQRLEALDLFKKGIAAKKNTGYYTREGVPKELMGKFSKLISSQAVGSRPEIFGTSKEVKLKLEDIEYNPAENFVSVPRQGKSPFDINFGDIPLFSNQEFTSNLLSPEEQALAERYPLMKNTVPNKLNPFNEPRSTPRTGQAPIQKDTFDITENYKGREEAKFFGTFELKTGFEEIGYVPRNENPIFIKTIPSGQRIEALDLFKTGIKAKLNPEHYERLGVPKELMGNYSKRVSEQTTGNKLPEIFGEKAEDIIKESNLDAFYSPSQNIRQFFERLESNKPNVHNNSNLKGYGIERLELNITKNKTKINTDKLLGIDNEEPTIGESKSRLEDIIKGGISRENRERKFIREPQMNLDNILSNARSFFENEKNMFSEHKISLGTGTGRLVSKGGGLASILKNFGKPSNPPAKPEEPKTTKGNGQVLQLLTKEKEETIIKEKISTGYREDNVSLGQGTITIPKKARRITAGLVTPAILQVQETKQEQAQSLIFQPLQTFKQAQALLYKPAQKQKQPQDLQQIFEQEQSPAVAQLFKQTSIQQLKQPQLTKLIEENPFPTPTPQKQIQSLEIQPEVFPRTRPVPEPPLPPVMGPTEPKKHNKKKKKNQDLADFIGNSSDENIEGLYNRSETTYGLSRISKLVGQDYARTSKNYNTKIVEGKAKVLFSSPTKTVKVKGNKAKPSSLESKYKKKLKI